ncbi:MAG: tetratricopeptide repeat protein [Myxococcota bacterium]|nr:tetratricopeptide repeat protein [Myxococcota bacterium]
MLRRSCLRLVGTIVLLVSGCGFTAAPVNTDTDSVPYSEVLDGRELLTQGKLAQAEARFAQLLSEHPGSYQASRGLQDVHRAGMEEQAFRATYRSQVDEQPDSSLAWYLHGRSVIDRPALARDSFDRAVELDSANSWAVAGLAYLAYERGDLFEAVQTYEEAIKRAPRSAQLRLFLGNQYLELKLYVDAQRHLALARRLAPSDPEVWAAQGKAWLALGEEERALEILEQTRSTEPRIGHIYPTLAAIYLRRAQPETADEAYRAGLALGLAADEELAAEIQSGLILRRIRQEQEQRRASP